MSVGNNGGVIVIAADDPLAVEATEVVQAGELERLARLLQDNPTLATAHIGTCPDGMSRTLLHAATDWPGHFPNNPQTVQLLIDAGADVNARFTGPHTETPLHWAASSDDVDVLDVLLDNGADIEATGAVIAGGTPLADATAFGQWNAAQRLIERGAKSNMFESATLGLLDRIEPLFNDDAPPSPDFVTGSFWGACHGGQLATAKYLLDHGADVNWVSSWDSTTPLDAARRSEAGDVVEWLVALGAHEARDEN
jgi:ankyrin repeat protein